MVYSLRKGHTSVYLEYEHGGDSMGAECFEAEVHDGTVTVRFSLRPVDGNQRDDENRLHSEILQSIQISDEYVIDRLSEFLSRQTGVSGISLEILSKGKRLKFSVEPGAVGLGFLPLLVKSKSN